MSKTLQQILGAENLTGVINSVSGGVPDLLPAALLTPTRSIDGHTGTYMKVENTRQAARQAPYGSKARERVQVGMTEVPFTAIHTVESIRHKAATLVNLRGENGEGKQRLGMQEVARQTREFKRRFANLRRGAVYSALSLGAVHFDADGELLPSSSGAGLSVDFGIAAGHLNQLNWDGNGAIIAASWATAGTSIVTHVKKLKDAMMRESGQRIGHCFYGLNIPEYFAKNATLKEYIDRDPAYRTTLASGEVPAGFLGVANWTSVNEAFYEDKDGVLQSFFGVDTCTFTPEVNTDWYDLPEGTYPVPTGIGVGENAEDMLSNFGEKAGMFSYSVIEMNPPSILQVAGDTFLPILRNPNAVFIADVTP